MRKSCLSVFFLIIACWVFNPCSSLATTKIFQKIVPTSGSTIAQNNQLILFLRGEKQEIPGNLVLVNQNHNTTRLKVVEKFYAFKDFSAYVLQPRNVLNIGDTVSLDWEEPLPDSVHPPFNDEYLFKNWWYVGTNKDKNPPKWEECFYPQKNNLLHDRWPKGSNLPNQPSINFHFGLSDEKAPTRKRGGDTCFQMLAQVQIDTLSFLLPFCGRPVGDITFYPNHLPGRRRLFETGETCHFKLKGRDLAGNTTSSKTNKAKFNKTDPTSPANNPRILKNINPDNYDSLSLPKEIYSESSRISKLTTAGDYFYFLADHQKYGKEPWISDGTSAGTHLLKDLWPGSKGSDIEELVAWKDQVFFIGRDSSWNSALWTAKGKRVTQLSPERNKDFSPVKFLKLDNQLYVISYRELGIDFWKTDGSLAGTQKVTSIKTESGFSAARKSEVFYCFTTDRNAKKGEKYLYYRDLWCFNSDSGNARKIKTFSDDQRFHLDPILNYEKEIYYQIDYENQKETWKTDGTKAGTEQIEEIFGGASICGQITRWQGKFYFAGKKANNLCHLMVADDVLCKPKKLTNIDLIQTYKSFGEFKEYKGRLYFVANDSVHGKEVWYTDGSQSGTGLLSDINPYGSSRPNHLIEYAGHLYFVAEDQCYGRTLWKTDGTNDGTKRVIDLTLFEKEMDSRPQVFEDALYFSGSRFLWNYGEELWQYDVTEPIKFD